MVSNEGIVVLSKDSCPNCVVAKSLLSGRGVAFSEVNLSKKGNESFVTWLKEQGYRSVPLIFNNGEFVGDHTKVVALLTAIGE